MNIQRINRDYYVVRRNRNNQKKGLNGYDWFPVRITKYNAGIIYMPSPIYCPKEFIGKRIKLKVEIIKSSESEQMVKGILP